MRLKKLLIFPLVRMPSLCRKSYQIFVLYCAKEEFHCSVHVQGTTLIIQFHCL